MTFEDDFPSLKNKDEDNTIECFKLKEFCIDKVRVREAIEKEKRFANIMLNKNDRDTVLISLKKLCKELGIEEK